MGMLPEFDWVSTAQQARKPRAECGAIVLTIFGYGSYSAISCIKTSKDHLNQDSANHFQTENELVMTQGRHIWSITQF